MVKSGLRKISGIDVATQQRANFYLQMFLGRGSTCSAKSNLVGILINRFGYSSAEVDQYLTSCKLKGAGLADISDLIETEPQSEKAGLFTILKSNEHSEVYVPDKSELKFSDNPYWNSYGQVHHIEVEKIADICFQLSNIFYASRPILRAIEAAVSEEECSLEEIIPEIAKLHRVLAFAKISELLLHLALLVRTYDDQMKKSDVSEEYRSNLKKIQSSQSIGCASDTNNLNLRHACNKIIHAQEIRPLYESLDVDEKGSERDIRYWYLTSEIELQGDACPKGPWDAVLYVHGFIDCILELIAKEH
ncbi:hypothetical protein QFX18_13490 [Saccharophagus degradans]|uniref:hypothetical protein n=1 Tax=Saccharophagus degradans TaxID=86304 RepID=UPI002477E4C8|nr:hypothetical protein [Saccharophagus degradans]WGO97057.1 hypothetical protein QFX18_13490 [Saccharophagus degradans]